MMWTTVNSTSQKTEIRISKLVAGNGYVFRVMAENAQGISDPAETPVIIAKDRYGEWAINLVWMIGIF